MSGRQPDWRKLRSRNFDIGSMQQQTRSVFLARKAPGAEAEEGRKERKKERPQRKKRRPKRRTFKIHWTNNHGSPDMLEASAYSE
jgi:hypothetical protein